MNGYGLKFGADFGSHPSAFHVASRLLSRRTDASLRLHLYDRLWAPHGLVRYGVAQTTPRSRQNCTHKFDQAAADPRFRFYGNVNIGTAPPPGMPHTSCRHYSHLVFATGCTLPTLHTTLADSPWCMPALGFVHWYTQHPSAPPPPALDTLTHVALIGNGNVALDIARILLIPVSVLEKYDVPQDVLDVLARSTVHHVDITARRGPLHAAFTAKELRELTNLPDAAMRPIAPQLLAVPPSTLPTRQQSRILQLLAQGSRTAFGTTRKTWALEFFKSPTGLAPPLPGGTSASARRPTPRSSTPPRGTCARARGVYASGWAANGARGVLATTMRDAYGVADAVLADADAGGESEVDGEAHAGFAMNPAPLDELPPPQARDAAAGSVVTYPDWKRVDAEEVKRGEVLGKERERMGWEEAKAFFWGGWDLL
ncbi:hypothetical protein C8R47DRAFT_1181884 [Mycena vitilis]|nr:hypothetical protein C8R47DRAFT_1181884 [Mycena vitilis]